MGICGRSPLRIDYPTIRHVDDGNPWPHTLQNGWTLVAGYCQHHVHVSVLPTTWGELRSSSTNPMSLNPRVPRSVLQAQNQRKCMFLLARKHRSYLHQCGSDCLGKVHFTISCSFLWPCPLGSACHHGHDVGWVAARWLKADEHCVHHPERAHHIRSQCSRFLDALNNLCVSSASLPFVRCAPSERN